MPNMTPKSKEQKERAWNIFRLRGMIAFVKVGRTSGVFTNIEANIVECVIEDALKRMGAETTKEKERKEARALLLR